MTNNAFLMIVNDFLKQKKITMTSPVQVKDKSGVRTVTSVHADADGDTVLMSTASKSNKYMSLNEVYIRIPLTNSMVFANAISNSPGFNSPSFEYDDFLVDDIYVENGSLVIEHV